MSQLDQIEEALDWEKTQTHLLEKLSVLKRYIGQFGQMTESLTGPEQEIWKRGLVVKGEVRVGAHPDFVTVGDARKALEAN